MFVKCAACGYLTPERAELCKKCGTPVGSVPTPAPEPASATPSTPFAPPVAASDPALTPAPPAPPAPAAALLDTMPPPAPGTAAPGWGSAAPPRPPPPAMFPAPGAQPAQPLIRTGFIVAGAVAVVGFAVLVGLAVTSGRDRTSERASQEVPATLARDTPDAMAASTALLTTADFGSRYRVSHEGSMVPGELVWGEPCSSAAGLQRAATSGTSIDLDESTPGSDLGSASAWVKAYASSTDAEAQFAARTDDAYTPCIMQFDTEDTECSCGTTASSLGVRRAGVPTGLRSSIFDDTLVTSQTPPQTYFVRTAFVVHGRLVGKLALTHIGAPPDPAEFERLLRVLDERLAANAPT